ncbi:MAG TPA: hypothetical protein VHI13_06155 [Candidatus Kapabacteria bacterium]|nr:hypothetical protein [Candidatus Kapabacteria bacterium]
MKTMMYVDLVATRILLESSKPDQELKALVCDTSVRHDSQVELLGDLGFEREGAGPHWTLRWGAGGSSRPRRDVLDILEPVAVWHIGDVHSAQRTAPLFERAAVANEWQGEVSLCIGSTGHCMVFTAETPESELREAYEDVRRNYLVSEFRPSE